MTEEPGAARTEEEMREHEQKAREHSEHERDDARDPLASGGDDNPVGTPDEDAMPAPPGNIQGGNLGGAS